MKVFKNRFVSSVKFGMAAVICAGALSACQTTQVMPERDVTLEDVDIVLPDSLLNLKGFKVERVYIREEGSYVAEYIDFRGGFFSFERYYRGGFPRVSDHNVDKIAARYYPGFVPLKTGQSVRGDIGTMYHTTLYSAEKDVTCVVGLGNQGMSLSLRRGPGYSGRINGEYCEKGKQPNLDESVVGWLKKIKLRS